MLIARPVPTSRPPRPGRKRKLAALTTLGLAGLLVGLLAGCATGKSSAINAGTTAQTNIYGAVAGNWKFTTATSAHTSALAGSLSVTGTTVTGTVHPLLAPCATSADAFPISGSIDASGTLSITSDNFSAGSLSITGKLSADQHSLVTPSVTITGGTCATAATLPGTISAHTVTAATAQQYQPLTGNYNGTFTDASGATLAVSANLSQPTTPDANGVYHLTGSATFPNTDCLNKPVITDSTVTGDSIQATYTDQQTGNTVSGTGTFSADAQTLTISSWALTGCGGDTGSGLLLRQTN